MVLSYILKDQEISYPETNRLEKHDLAHKSALYKLELVPKKEYVIALGPMQTEHMDKGCVYFHIFLVNYKKKGSKTAKSSIMKGEDDDHEEDNENEEESPFAIQSKIGVFEVETERSLAALAFLIPKIKCICLKKNIKKTHWCPIHNTMTSFLSRLFLPII